MAKTGSNFKLQKTTKRVMAMITRPEGRAHYKRAMIDAQYADETIPKTVKRERNADAGSKE